MLPSTGLVGQGSYFDRLLLRAFNYSAPCAFLSASPESHIQYFPWTAGRLQCSGLISIVKKERKKRQMHIDLQDAWHHPSASN